MSSISNITDTWNDPDADFDGIRLDVTDTESGAGSKLLNLRKDGTTVFSVDASGHLYTTGYMRPGNYTVATVPAAATAGAGGVIYVSDEAGGAVLAFSDGTNWRRVTDRAVIS